MPTNTNAIPLLLTLALFTMGISCEEFLENYDFSRVAIISPEEGQVFASAQTVTLVAEVVPELADHVTKVEFFDHYAVDQPGGHGTPTCTDDTGPTYTCDWRIVAVDNGPHYWNALAYFDNGHPAMFAASVLFNVNISGSRRSTAGVEQRCIELGANCDCSETLDGAFVVTEGGGVPYSVNPTSSSGDLQCGNAQGHFLQGNHDPNVYLTSEPARNMPTTSTVQNVWKWNVHGVDTGGGRKDRVDTATRRLCQRMYVKFSPDFSPWPDCNNKVMEMHWSGNAQLQSSTSVDQSRIMLNVGGGFSADVANHIPGPDSISPAECSRTWCRVEMCVAGEVAAGRGMTADFFVSTTDGQLQASKTGIYLGDATGGLEYLWPLNLYRETANGSCNGAREYSHVIQASWNNDAGQTVGPAIEIEGR